MATVDLSLLPPPEVIETRDFERILTDLKTQLIAATPEAQRAAVAFTLTLESEPLTKLLQVWAYREMLLRQRINEAALASMVGFARGADLDQLAANNNVKRLVVSPGDEHAIPPIAPTYESDADLRQRIPGAFEALSVAGPIKSYEYHARSADGRVADATAISPSPACVTVTVLSREDDGQASADLIHIVNTALNDDDVRPVADRVTVQSATIVNYHVDAVIYCYPAPEYEPIIAAAEAQLTRYVTEQHRLGRNIVKSALYAALHVQGVQRVALNAPTDDIHLDKTQAGFCTGLHIALGGNDA